MFIRHYATELRNLVIIFAKIVFIDEKGLAIERLNEVYGF